MAAVDVGDIFDDELEEKIMGEAAQAAAKKEEEEEEESDDSDEIEKFVKAKIKPATADTVPMLGGWGATTTTTTTKKKLKKTNPDDGKKKKKDAKNTGIACLGDMMEQAKLAQSIRSAEQDPHNAQKHLSIITLLAPHQSDPDAWTALQSSRENMVKTCAMSMKQYAGWILQEREHGASAKTIYSLLQKATTEFHSVPLLVEQCEVLNEMLEEELESLDDSDPSYDEKDSARIVAVRAEYEAAIDITGTHYTEGHLLWESYRAFFLAEGCDTDPDKAFLENQLRLYRRQACIPHEQCDETSNSFNEFTATYKAHLTGEDFSRMIASVERSFNLSSGLQKTILPYEEKVASSTNPKETDAAWLSYIDAEAKRDSKKAAAIAERAVLASPWSVNLWMKGIRTMMDGGLREPAVQFAKRSLRSIPRSIKLWVEVFRCLEGVKNTVAKNVLTVLEASQKVAFKSDHDNETILYEAISLLKRLPASDATPAAVSLCNAHLKKADTPSHALHLIRFLLVLTSPSDVSVVYDSAFSGNAQLMQFPVLWEAYLDGLQRGLSVPDEAVLKKIRGVFKHGVSALGAHAGRIAEMWLNFERLHGTAVDIDRVRDKNYEMIRKYQEKAERTMDSEMLPVAGNASESDNDGEPEGTAKDKRTLRKRRLEEQQKEAKWEQHKTDLGLEAPTGPAELTAFLWNLPFRADESEIREFLKGVSVTTMRVIKGKNGVPKGIAYVDVTDSENMEAILKYDKKKFQGRQVRVQVSDPRLMAKPEEEDEVKKLQIKRQKRAAFQKAPVSFATGGTTGGAKGNSFFKSLLSKK